MELKPDVESRIRILDASLYESVLSQTSNNDRRSLLALQNAVRDKFGSYVYLEIGSYLGGSIQPHLLDPRCRKIYSIDKRTLGDVPDVRGSGVAYTCDSSQQMLDHLKQLAPDQVNKIICFDDDAGNIPGSLLGERPHLCFIDGEHTNSAVYSDFRFCLSICDPNGVIAFHDSDLIYKGIAAAVLDLLQQDVSFVALKLPDIVYCIGLGNNEVVNDEVVRQFAEDGLMFIRSSLVW